VFIARLEIQALYWPLTKRTTEIYQKNYKYYLLTEHHHMVRGKLQTIILYLIIAKEAK